MEKLKNLDFTNANNACISLHTLAEWVRTGEIIYTEVSTNLIPDLVTAERIVAFAERGRR